MKRKCLCFLLTVTLIASMLIGCGKETANNTDNEPNNINNNEDNREDDGDINDDSDDDSDNEDNSGNEDNSDTDNGECAFSLSFIADDEFDSTMAAYPNYTLVVVSNDDYSVKVLISTTSETLTNLEFYTLELIDFDDSGKATYNETVVSQLDELTPDRPVVLQMTFGEFIPTVGFSYVDAAGNRHKVGITESGKDGSIIAVDID